MTDKGMNLTVEVCSKHFKPGHAVIQVTGPVKVYIRK